MEPRPPGQVPPEPQETRKKNCKQLFFRKVPDLLWPRGRFKDQA